MKHLLHKAMIVSILILCLGMSQQIFAQVSGDFRSAISGNWGTSTTWERYNGTIWEGSGIGANTGLLPTSATSVYIQSGHLITLTADGDCKDFHIATGTTIPSASLLGRVDLGTFSLNINGKMRCYTATVNTVPGASSTAGFSIFPFLGSGAARVNIVGTSRTIFNTGEWISTTTSTSTGVFPLEINMTAGNAATFATSFRSSSLKLVSGNVIATTGFVTGAFTIGTGCNYATSANFTPGVSCLINGTFQISQGGFVTGGTWTYGAAGTLLYNVSTGPYGVSGTPSYWPATSGPVNLTISGGGGVTVDVARTISGTVTINSGGLGGSAPLTVNGTCQINGGNFNTAPIYGPASTLIYNTSYGTFVEWNTVGTATVAAGAGNPANVQILSGTCTLAGARGVPGNLTVNSGATLVLNATSGNDFFIAGNLTMNGTLTHNTRTVFFVKSNNQTISRTSGNITFQGLNVNKTAGAVTLAIPIIVAGNLTMAAGNLDLAAFDATVTGTLSGSASSYIKTSGAGQVKKIVAGTLVAFPVGNSSYNPLSLTNSGTSDTYGVSVADGAIPAAINTNYGVNRIWKVTEAVPGAGNLAVVAQYNTADGLGSGYSSAAPVYLGLYNPSTWIKTTATHGGANPFTVTSGTNFTASLNSNTYFAVGNLDAFEAPVAGPPTIATTLAPFSITENSATSGGQTITGSGITNKGIVWDFFSGVDTSFYEGITNQGATNANFTSNLTGLLPQTLYYVRAYATNSIDTGYGPEISFYTVSPTPTAAATGFTATAIGTSQIDLSWTASSFPGGSANGYIILKRTDGTNPASTGVVDGIVPGSLSLPAGTTLAALITSGSTTAYSDSSLSFGTHNYMIIPFTWDGTNAGTYNYLLTAAPTATASLLATVPSAQPTGLAFSAVTYNAMTVNWTAASPSVTGYLVLRTTGATAPDTDPSTGTAYSAGSALGNATVAYAGPGLTTTLSLIADNTQNNFKIYSYNGTGASIIYLTASPLAGSQSTLNISAPTATAATSPSGSGLTATWTAVTGAASYRLDVATDSGFTSILTGYNNLTVAGLSQPVTGLTAATTYYYRVRAVGINSTSVDSNTITAATTSPKVSAISGFWNVGSTWVGGVAPSLSEDVEIAAGTTVTINSAITQTGSILVNTGATLATSVIITTNGNVTVNGTFKVQGTLSGGGSPVVTAASTGVWTYSQTTSTLYFNSNATYNIDSGTPSNVFWPTAAGFRPFNVTVEAVNNGNALQMNNNTRTIDGTLTMKGTASNVAFLYGNTANFTVNGTVQLDLGGSIPNNGYLTYGPNATLKFNQGGAVTNSGNGAWTPGITGPGLNLPGNVQVSNNTTLSINNTLDYNVKGNLTIDSGSSLNPPAAQIFTVSGNLVNNGTYTFGLSAGASLYLGGNFTNNGTITYNGRLLNFTGIAQTIGGTSANNFGNVRLSNGTNVTLNGAASISSNLSFTSGKLILGNYDLTMGSGATFTTPTGTSYIQTNGTGQLKQIVAGTAVAFPVGNSAYNPITLTNTGTSDTYGVAVVDGAVSTGLNPTKAINRRWMISEAVAGGSNLTPAVLQYNTGEEGAAFNAGTTPKIGIYNGSTWTTAIAVLAGSNPYTGTASVSAQFPATIAAGSYLALGKDDAFNYRSIALVGPATPQGWPTDPQVDATALTTTDGIHYVLNNVTLVNGEAKFRQENSWTTNWGWDGGFPTGTVSSSGDNFNIPEGTFNITFNRTTGVYNFERVGAPTTNLKHILFVGNSYTFYNGMAFMTEKIAASLGDNLIAQTQTIGGTSLEEHASNASTTSRIQQGGWDYVVLQDNSTRPALDDAYVALHVYPFATQLSNMARQYSPCTDVFFYQTWGRKNGDSTNCPTLPAVCTYEGMDDRLQLRYAQMATDNAAAVSPAAAVRRQLRLLYPSMELYISDESHPTLVGSYVSSVTFNTVLYRKDPTLITYNSTLSSTVADQVKAVVKSVVFDHLATWNVGVFDPSAAFTYSATANTVTFTNTSLNAQAYAWDFGDSTSSTAQSPQHTFAGTGPYTVTLTVTKCGKQSTTSQTFVLGAPTGPAVQNFCVSATVADLVATGSNIQWYTDPITGTALLPGTSLANGHYYASQTDNGVESSTRLDVTVTISPATVAGSISGATSVCSGTSSTVLTLNGSTGSIQWQSSINNTTFTNVLGATDVTYTATNLSATTYYRAVITSGACGSLTTSSVTMTVNNAVGYANLQWPPSGGICLGGSYTTYGQVYQGGVTVPAGQGAGITAEFGYSTSNTNPSTWTNWTAATYLGDVGNNDEYTFNFTPATSGTYYYAYRYRSGACNYQYGGFQGGFWDGTNNVSGVLTVSPPTAAGNITGATTVCSATNSTTLTLNGSSGPIQWQSSTDNSTFTDISGATATTYIATDIAVTTYFRAVMDGGGCPSANAAAVAITFGHTPEYANLQYPGSGTICLGGVFNSYGQVYHSAITPGAGQGAGITVDFGYSTSDTNPSTWSNWEPATFNTDSGNNDEYKFAFTPLAAGTYYYTYRYTTSCGTVYGGFNEGFWDGTSHPSGVLTVSPVTEHTTTISACDTYTWTAGNNVTYTQSGNYPYVTGCHTETLALTITPTSAHTTTVSACDTYTWTEGNNVTYTASGNYVFENGCHTETLALTISTGTVYYADEDGDGFGNPALMQSACAGAPLGYVSNNTDCNDDDENTFQSNNLYTDVDGDGYDAGTGQEIICYGASIPAGYVLTTLGTDCNDNAYSTTNTCSGSSVVNLTMFIQGYYTFGGAMASVRVNQEIEGADIADVEMLTVELHDAENFSMVTATTAMLHTDGTLSASFDDAPSGSYYIAIKGRNSIQTWSAEPQTVGSTPLAYNFSTAASQAYGDNMIDMGEGVFAFYSGDIAQDELIEFSDYSAWETDAFNFAFGDFATDLTGDGLVEFSDYSIWEANAFNFIYAQYPF
jgi:hypothetical protein